MALADHVWFRAVAGGTDGFEYGLPMPGGYPGDLNEGEQYNYRATSDDKAQWEIGRGTVTGGVLMRDSLEYSSNEDELVDFSAAPHVAVIALSEDFERMPWWEVTANVNAADGPSISAHAGLIWLDGAENSDPVTLLPYSSVLGERMTVVVNTMTDAINVDTGNVRMPDGSTPASVIFTSAGQGLLLECRPLTGEASRLVIIHATDDTIVTA